MALLLNAGDTVSRSYSYTQPSPLHPSLPQECGERTGNLFDISKVVTNVNVTNQGDSLKITTPSTTTGVAAGNPFTLQTYCPNLQVGDVVTLSFVSTGRSKYIYLQGENITWVSGQSKTITSTMLSSAVLWYASGVSTEAIISNVMLNLGSTALPYENFGYKIPILSGGENLFDYPQDNYSTTINSVVWTIENGVIKGEGFTTSQGEQDCILVRKNGLYRAGNYPNYYSLNASTDMKLPAGTYTFSYIPITEPTTISSRPRLIIGHEGGRYIDETAKFVWNGDTFTVDSDDYVALALNTSNSIGEYEFGKFMLNRGSTALPYEPYNRTTTPIYLGEVQTTRKIKKLVLTGEEYYTESTYWKGAETSAYYTEATGIDSADKNNIVTISSHFKGVARDTATYNDIPCVASSNRYVIFRIESATASTAAEFKQWLAQQYASGTPVTVWYVLATPETGIVNEPLRKIGDYADEVSGITIPTIAGTNALSIGTTLQPSEVSVNYKGWHPTQNVHEAENGQWD